MENNMTTGAAAVSAAKEEKGSIVTEFPRKVKKTAKKALVSLNTAMLMAAIFSVNAFADGSLSTSEGETQFNQIIQFFATWIGRIGLVVGFVGAVMFGLAIKNEDAEAKTRGLMTLASGFVVFAVTKALDLFGITSA